MSPLDLQTIFRSISRPLRAHALIQYRTFRLSSKAPASINEIFQGRTPNEDFTAASPINLDVLPPPNTSRGRLVPASPSYFSSRPESTDNYLSLQALLRRHQTLPIVSPGQAPRVAWRTLVQYRLLVGEPVRAARYHKILDILHRLNRIHPLVVPDGLQEALEIYRRDVDPHAIARRSAVIDKDGKACGIGRRKEASAKVFLVPGDGQIMINGKSLGTVFGRLRDRESALWPLKATARINHYNVWALVSGGGTTGQAEALTLGVAKALLVFEPELKPALRRAGCVTRDRRRVERKKPGRLKARKMPTWVKR